MSEEEAPKRNLWLEMSPLLRKAARNLLHEMAREDELVNVSEDRAVILVLESALWDAYRDEWYATVERADLGAELVVARKLMEGDNYGPGDPICGMPGQEPYICMVDGKKAVCFDFSMQPLRAMPLSAFYVNKVREAIEISALVGELVVLKEAGAKEAKGDGDDDERTVPHESEMA